MTSIITNPRERVRFGRFAVVGLIGAVVDFGTMNLLTRFLNFSLVLAGTISFIAAIFSNFLWNRYWTYPDSRSKPVSRQLLQFGLVNIAGLLIRVPLLAMLEPLFEKFFAWLPIHIPLLSSSFLAKNFDLAVAVVVVMFWNFFANRYWTYSDVSD
jgi:putative flippase GtrA